MTNADWIRKTVFYQIYPTSFFDANGDGIGDLQGIIQKVDYVKDLGVGAVWLNPIFKSPFKDGGYDVTDYYVIDKKFGDMEDLKELVKVFHEKDIKVILDMVFGHTSNKHQWFKASARVKRNHYSDYYVWSNSNFEEYNHALIKGLYYRDGGYLMNYYASQPALNFGFHAPDQAWQMHYKDERLKPLRDEIISILRFYLDMGIDGFRFDMAGHMIKGEQWDDDSINGNDGHVFLWNTILGELRRDYKDKVYIAEWDYPLNSVKKCGFDFDFLTHDELTFNTLFRNEPNTNLVRELERGDNYFSEKGRGSITEFIDYIEKLYHELGKKGYFSTPTGSHDEIRISNGKSSELMKTAFAFLMTYKNVAFIYYGDEIGLPHDFTVSKDGGSIRTGARTPMQWNEDKNRVFSIKNKTYLSTNNIENLSVSAQEKDKSSLLNTVKKLVKLRKSYPCLFADAEQVFLEKGYPLVYERRGEDKVLRIYINPSNYTFEREVDYKKEIYSTNVEINKNKITLKAQSFAILEL